MTSYADLVNAEAVDDEDGENEAAEADELTEPETEPETEDEPGAQATIGPDEIRKAERAIEAQRRKLAGILGDENVAHECPVCSAMGFLPELPPDGTKITIVHGEDGAGFTVEAPNERRRYPQAKNKRGCDACERTGFQETGSENPNADVAPCEECQGNGWVTYIPQPQTVYVQPNTSPNAAPHMNPPEANVGNDAWGRPQGHPHWGVPPAAVGA